MNAEEMQLTHKRVQTWACSVSDQVREKIAELTSKINSVVVKCDGDVEYLASAMKSAKKIVKTINEARKSYTSKLDEEKQLIMSQEKILVRPIEEALAKAKQMTDEYLAERQRIAEEARRKALEEAQKQAEAARKAEEEAQKQAEAARALGIPVEPVNAYAPNNLPTTSLTPAEVSSLSALDGIGARVSWDFEIVNPYDLPRCLLSPNIALIKAEIATLKKSGMKIEDVHVPGLRVYAKTTTVIR